MSGEMALALGDLWREAHNHIDRGRFDKAIEKYKYILVRYADNSLANEYANAYLGDILFTLSQTNLAESHIKKALSLRGTRNDNEHAMSLYSAIS